MSCVKVIMCVEMTNVMCCRVALNGTKEKREEKKKDRKPNKPKYVNPKQIVIKSAGVFSEGNSFDCLTMITERQKQRWFTNDGKAVWPQHDSS